LVGEVVILSTLQKIDSRSACSVRKALVGTSHILLGGKSCSENTLPFTDYGQSFTACVVSNVTSCSDLTKALTTGQCSDPRSVRGQIASLYTSYAMDVLTDLMSKYDTLANAEYLLTVTVMSLPIKLVWGLQLARCKKLAVIALFASGFVCITFATVRVVQIDTRTASDTSPSPTRLALWTVIESAIAICIGCGPAFVSLYRTTHAPSVSYDTNGYIRRCRRDVALREFRTDAINIPSMPSGIGRSSMIKSGVYENDTSSQEALAADTTGIRITKTLHQSISSNASGSTLRTSTHHDAWDFFALASSVSPAHTRLAQSDG
jgi:hypothetical protein